LRFINKRLLKITNINNIKFLNKNLIIKNFKSIINYIIKIYNY